MSYFKIVNSSFYSDSSDDLDHVCASEYIEDDEDKTESQQIHHGNSTYMFKPRVTDNDNMSAEADRDGQSQNPGRLVDISLR